MTFSLPHCLRVGVSKPQLAGQISVVEFRPPFWNFGWIEAGGNHLLWYLSFLIIPQIPSTKTQPPINKIWQMVSCNFLRLGQKAELFLSLPVFFPLKMRDENGKFRVQIIRDPPVKLLSAFGNRSSIGGWGFPSESKTWTTLPDWASMRLVTFHLEEVGMNLVSFVLIVFNGLQAQLNFSDSTRCLFAYPNSVHGLIILLPC